MPKLRSAPQPSTAVDPSSAPVVRLVLLMIQEAVQLRASHILLATEQDSTGDTFTIHYIIDGKSVERDSPPSRLLGALITRIKILAKLDIADHETLQRGTFKMAIDVKEVELIVHVVGKNLLIELAPRESGAVTPAAVEEWWQLHAK